MKYFCLLSMLLALGVASALSHVSLANSNTQDADPAPTALPDVSETHQVPAPQPPPPPPPPAYTIQIGAFESVRKAATIRAILEHIGPARVERVVDDHGSRLYRIILGKFETIDAAEEFAEKNQLKKLFPESWMNPMSIEAVSLARPGEPVSQAELDKDPYVLHVNLYCDADRRWGEYKAEMQPEAGKNEAEILIHWNCIPHTQGDFAANDWERHPTYLGISPFMGFGTLTSNNSALTPLNLSSFNYGVQVTAFKSISGFGPTLDYRLTNHRYSSDALPATPIWEMDHDAVVGFRLPVSHRLEFEPVFGYYWAHFYDGTSLSTAAFNDAILPQAGMNVTLDLFELRDRASISLTGGFRYIFPATTSTLSISSGTTYYGSLRTRHFFPQGGLGADWFVEYSASAQNASNPTEGATIVQSETALTFGISILFSP